MRAVILSGFPPDAAHIRNGVQAASTYLVQGLACIDALELHFLTFRPAGWKGPDCTEQNGVFMQWLRPYPRFERLRDYRKYQKIVNERLSQIQPHIVHAQGASSDALVALRTGYPVVITAHGIRKEEHKYYKSWGDKARSYIDSALTEQRVMRRARYLIAISRYMVQYFQKQLRPDLQCFSIPNAVDDQFFAIGNSQQRETAGKSPVVLYAGRVTQLKRVFDLVKAFASVLPEFPTAQLRIAGDCRLEAAYAESIREWIAQQGLAEHIHLLGEQNQAAILREFAACDVFALPSAQENTPMVIAQAMAAGKPVVATRVGGIPEMIGANNERGRLVRSGDIDGMAGEIKRFLADPESRNRAGEAARSFALENYHSSRVAQRTFEVYQQVIAAEQKNHA